MKKTYIDPTTGDEITKSDYLSLVIQNSIIRRWWFIGQFTLITLACVLTFNINVVGWWNVYASYLAIFVESIVGRYMSNQVKRDAHIIRDTRKILHQVKDILEEVKLLQKTDFEHQEADYEVSLDVNQKLGHVLDILHDEFEHEDPIEGWYGEWNE